MAPRKTPPDRLADRMRTVVAHASPAPASAPKLPSRIKPRSPRAEKYKHGVLLLPDGERVDVILRNLSEKGARIDFYAGNTGLSGPVLLLEPSLGLKKQAIIVWKDRNSAGLLFVGEG
jgi:hypothetical protein